MYKIRENDISLSPTIQSLTWHPFIFASISGRLPMMTPLGQITPVSIRTFSLSDKYHYFAAVISRYAEISFPFNQSYIQCFQKFTKSAQCSSFKQDSYGARLHLVACPQNDETRASHLQWMRFVRRNVSLGAVRPTRHQTSAYQISWGNSGEYFLEINT